MIAPNFVAKLVEGRDIRSLPLTPIEGFVLSRVNGQLTASEVAEHCGLPFEQVAAALGRLVELAVVTSDSLDASAQPALAPRSAVSAGAGSTPSGSTPSGSTSSRPVEEQPSSGAPVSERAARAASGEREMLGTAATRQMTAFRFDPAQLDEEVVLSREQRVIVLDTFYALRQVSHYRLLGVSRDADRKVVRSAYFERSKVFHPDTFFGGNLGSFKSKMEAVFKAMTEAYQVLGKKKAREKYDATLGDEDAEVRLLLDEPRSTAESEKKEPAPDASGDSKPASSSPPVRKATASAAPSGGMRADGEAPTDPPPPPPRSPAPPTSRAPSGASRPPSSATPPSDSPSRRPSGSRRAPDPARRGEVFAARLGSSGSRSPSPNPTPQETPGVDRDAVLRGLTGSLRNAATHTGGIDAAARLRGEALKLEEAGDLVNATAKMRQALEHAPDRQDLQREHQRLSQVLSATMADTYEQQARYEQGRGAWAAAAISWARVAEGRPTDSEPARQAAEAILKAKGDPMRAKALAQQAVDRSPEDPRCRLLLGRIYLSAGMFLNARRELEVAARLDPSSDEVKKLLQEATR